MKTIFYGLLIGSLGTVVLSGYMWWAESNIIQPQQAPMTKKEQVVEKEKKNPDDNLPLYPKRPMKGEKIGTLEVPTLKAKLPVVEGTGDKELSKGVGHYQRSYLPGEPNLSVLAGHRETVFKDAGKIEKGDELITETTAGRFTYEVEKIWIVDADDMSVIRPYNDATLILSTCYPFEMVGSAPERYIIRAKLKHPKP